MLVIVGGCSENDGSTGTVRIQITDEPYPVDLIASAEVTIDRIEVRVKSDDSEGYHVLSETPQTIDLIDLRNGVTELLVEAEVPVGLVDQVRLRISEAHVVLTDDREFDLQVPSGGSSGLKIFPEPGIEVTGDLTAELLLDCDVSESFKPIPASARRSEDIDHFQFRPTLRVANLSETGTLSGTVWSDAGTPLILTDDHPIADATVRVAAGDDVYFTMTDSEGRFRIMGLSPGVYTVTVSAFDHGENVVAATVIVANDVTVGALLLVQNGSGVG
jgi:hypothetical protein